jgi:uncharacterized protein (DUF2235 family)
MKRIIICADGTWNFRDQVDDETKLRHATNVTKLARAIVSRTSKSVDQVVIYHDGVGTHEGLDHLVGGVTGEGIEGNIRDLYRAIAYNYADGDEIYLFGFSRGAYTVRTLAGFMFHLGLLQKSDDFFVPDLFKAYEAVKDLQAVKADPNFKNLHDVRPCPKISFIGVWDTVGALGAQGPLGNLINGNRFVYHDIELNGSIQNAYHALAIDERRVPFKPSLWTKPAGWSGTVEQTWFCGVHCNVGGGYSPDGLANEALHWLIERAEKIGLEVDAGYLSHFRPCFNSTLNDSMSMLYRPVGQYARPIGQYRAHGEQIHQSVIDRLNLKDLKYAPPNLTNDLIQGPQSLPIVNTNRISRGTPCEPAQEHPTPPR